MDYHGILGVDDVGPYQVHSRREIVGLLRGVQQQNQFVRMVFHKNSESIVTSILDIDAASGSLVIDCAPNPDQNKRILASESVSFETSLDRIRIFFFASRLEACQFEGRLALRIPLPDKMVRLQRREYFRVEAPSKCHVIIPFEGKDGKTMEVTAVLRDLSVGGIGITDESSVLDTTSGRIYADCRIFLTDGQVLRTNIRVCNSYETRLASGKVQRRIGCLFVEPPNQMVLAVQRYITRLERDRNAKATGLA